MMRVSWGLVLLVAAACSGQESCPTSLQPGCSYQSVRAIKKHIEAKSTSGHYYIGGLFDLREKGDWAYECGSEVKVGGVMNLEAFFWAINFFEQRLGNAVSVGGIAFDNCGRKEEAIDNIFGFEKCRDRYEGVSRRQLLAFVGPEKNDQAVAVAQLLQDLNITVVSPAATAPQLSDGKKYKFFLRTIPSEANDAVILADILTDEIKAKHVQVVYQDSEYGREGFEMFKKQAEKNHLCIVQSIMVTEDVSIDASSEVVAKLRDRTNFNVRYVLIYADGEVANRILRSVDAYYRQEQINQNIDETFLFFGTSRWGNNKAVFQNSVGTANNSVVVALRTDPAYREVVAAFRRHWDVLRPMDTKAGITNEYLNTFWTQHFQCSPLSSCNQNIQSLSSIPTDPSVPYTIMAVHAIMQGVKAAAEYKCNRYDLCSDVMNSHSKGKNFFNNIKKVRPLNDDTRYIFDLTMGPDRFGNEVYTSADPSKGPNGFSTYDIHSVVKGDYQLLGTMTAGGKINKIRELEMGFYRNRSSCSYPCTPCGEVMTTTTPVAVMTTEPMASTTKDPTEGGNFSLVKFPSNQEITGAYLSSPRSGAVFMTRFEIGQRWIIALGVLAGLGILAVIIFEIYILYKLLGTRMGSKWRTMWLGQLLLFGIFLSFLTLFAYIPVPTKTTCGITRFGVGVSYSVMFAVLLVKLMVILTSKTSETSLLPGDMESPNYLKGVYQFLMFMFAVGVQIVIDAQWLITVPPEAVQVYDNRGEPVWICNHYTWQASNGMNNMTTFVRNEFENHVLSLVYVMFLVLITTVLALNAHGIITNHRESIFIGIAAGFTIPVWLSWGLVGGLNRAHNFANEFGDACIAIGLFLTATLVLFAMFLPKVRQLVNIGVEGIYFEDDRETYYAGSVIMSPPSYKSKANSVLYVNNAGIYSEPIVVNNAATHLKHPGQHHPGPMSTYSAPPGFLKKSEGGSKVLRVTPDLTGKHPTERRRPQSEFAYTPRSVRGTLKRSRSQQNLGAL